MQSHMNCDCCGRPVKVDPGVRAVICFQCNFEGRTFHEREVTHTAD